MDGVELFKPISKQVPIHVIWGSKHDFKWASGCPGLCMLWLIISLFSPVYIKEALTDATQGRVAASVTEVEGAGHFVSTVIIYIGRHV